MANHTRSEGTVLRIFEANARPGCVEALLDKFATTSAAVVADASGNQGYFYGHFVQPATHDGSVMFVSVWTDLNAVKQRFGNDWEKSYIPAGYDDLIESCTIRHADVSAGWHLERDEPSPSPSSRR